MIQEILLGFQEPQQLKSGKPKTVDYKSILQSVKVNLSEFDYSME